jgi:hypothetical protein
MEKGSLKKIVKGKSSKEIMDEIRGTEFEQENRKIIARKRQRHHS